MLEIKNTVMEMKNAFGGLTSRLDKTKERINKLNFHTEMTKGNRNGVKGVEYSRT